MEEKKSEQRVAQILYVSIILLLLIAAIAVGLTGAAKKRTKPAETLPATTYVAPVTSPKREVRLPQVTAKLPTVTEAPKVAAEETLPVIAETEAAEVVADEPTEVLPTFILPTVGDVARTYTADVLVWSNTMADYRTHDGVDVAAAAGEAVMAAADGIVKDVYLDPRLGWTVVLSHAGDAETVYQNLAEEIAVETGDSVKCGEILGAVGDSAMVEIAEEPHLHFAMQVNGVTVDPLDYIAEATMTVVYEDE